MRCWELREIYLVWIASRPEISDWLITTAWYHVPDLLSLVWSCKRKVCPNLQYFSPYMFCCSIWSNLHHESDLPRVIVSALHCSIGDYYLSLIHLHLSSPIFHFSLKLSHLLHPWWCPHLFLEVVSSEISMIVIIIYLLRGCVICYLHGSSPHLFLEIVSAEISMAATLIHLPRDRIIYFQTKDILYRDIFSLREGVNSMILMISDVWVCSVTWPAPCYSFRFTVFAGILFWPLLCLVNWFCFCFTQSPQCWHCRKLCPTTITIYHPHSVPHTYLINF
jgi:hypothetical protein